MKALFALFLIWAVRAQVLAKVKTRGDNSHSAKALKVSSPTAHIAERRLIEAEKLKPMLEEAVKAYLWTVGDPADGVIVVSEKVGEVDTPMFKATLTEVEIKGSTEKRQLLTLENRPKDDADEQFKRYKHAHVLFRRSISDKNSNLLGPFLKHCAMHFKAITDRLKALKTAPGLIDIIKQVLVETRIPGVTLEVSYAQTINALFSIKDGSGSVRYQGSIYRVSPEYMGLALWNSDEHIYVYSGQGTEMNFKARIGYILSQKLLRPHYALKIPQIKDKVFNQIKARCPSDIPTLKSQSQSEKYFAAVLGASGNALSPTACAYGESKIVGVQYDFGKIQYVHLWEDLREFTTEDILLPNAAVFDALLSQAFNKNGNSVAFIRRSRSASKKESVADENNIKAVLIAAIGAGEPTEETPNADLKTAIEVEERKWLHSWAFKNNVYANLYQNKEEFIIEVSKINLQTRGATTTQIAVPIYNGYDHLGLIKQQIAEFIASQ